MTVFMFAPRFAPLVEVGSKRQTIRRLGKRRPPNVGEPLSLREWLGKPYRAKQRVLREALCAGVDPVRIEKGVAAGPPLVIEVAGVYVPFSDMDKFARADGFTDTLDMAAWWDQVHEMPFEGLLIRWEVTSG